MTDIPKLFKIHHTCKYDPSKLVDMRYHQDIQKVVENMSLTEMHMLHKAIDYCDKDTFWELLVGRMLENRAKRGSA